MTRQYDTLQEQQAENKVEMNITQNHNFKIIITIVKLKSELESVERYFATPAICSPNLFPFLPMHAVVSPCLPCSQTWSHD